MTAIIILNWNGADDTLACLDSLARAEGEFFVLVVDNGSADDSVARLQAYADRSPLDLTILPQPVNWGFAKGNNIGIACAMERRPDSLMLLNNDTEVTPDFLSLLTAFHAAHPEWRVLTPKINFFGEKDRIWNCGGTIRFGFRRYCHAGASDAAVAALLPRPSMPVTFVTGCALWFTPDVLDADGKLLTERFFFGEEDFDFSLRMQQQQVPMACVTQSLIYHKVGASARQMNPAGKQYLHLLNRYIDIRLHFSPCRNVLWRLVNVPLTLRHFYRSTRSLPRAVALWWHLQKDSNAKSSVTHDDFVRLVIKNELP